MERAEEMCVQIFGGETSGRRAFGRIRHRWNAFQENEWEGTSKKFFWLRIQKKRGIFEHGNKYLDYLRG
jgi:hypothetical protein